MKDFDFYEIIAVLTPGVALVLGGILLWSNAHQPLDVIKNLSLGGAAFGLLGAYVIGQYIQFFGHYVEKIFWFFFKGMPSRWIVEKGKLIKGVQYDDIVEHLKIDGFDIHSTNIDFNALHYWIRNKADDSNRKIYIMNSQYGMFRGLSFVWLFLLGLKIIMWNFCIGGNNVVIPILIILVTVSLLRMKHFGEYYAREMYNKYLIKAKAEHSNRSIVA